MNVRAVLFESILSSLEEEEQQCVENDIVDDILQCIHSIKQSIQFNREQLD